MANPDYPFKSYQYRGWTISYTGSNWQCVDKQGNIGTKNQLETVVKAYATNNPK